MPCSGSPYRADTIRGHYDQRTHRSLLAQTREASTCRGPPHTSARIRRTATAKTSLCPDGTQLQKGILCMQSGQQWLQWERANVPVQRYQLPGQRRMSFLRTCTATLGNCRRTKCEAITDRLHGQGQWQGQWHQGKGAATSQKPEKLEQAVWDSLGKDKQKTWN